MLKKILFRLFGHELNMGYVVNITDVPGVTEAGVPSVNIGDDQGFRAAKLLLSSIRNTPLATLLEEQGPFKLYLTMKEEWADFDFTMWYQHPHLKVDVVSIRFLNKPSWMVEASPCLA
jgi:hypothetical protein